MKHIIILAVVLLYTCVCRAQTSAPTPCPDASCDRKLTDLQVAATYTAKDYTLNLLDESNWIVTPGGNVSYFNLSTNPVLAGHGMSMTLELLNPCGIILPHIHPRGTKGVYNINAEKLMVGFIVENTGEFIMNELAVGGATFIPRYNPPPFFSKFESAALTLDTGAPFISS